MIIKVFIPTHKCSRPWCLHTRAIDVQSSRRLSCLINCASEIIMPIIYNKILNLAVIIAIPRI